MGGIPDNRARIRALDTERSFIVQAPAGSGKTSLLTQRFLALLSKVSKPEKIIAITFTKKAASEMRERIIDALNLATQPPPTEAYMRTSYDLAKKALSQDNRHNWQLLKNPERLRIQTIDSLCHYLTKRMPLFSQSIPYSEVTTDPEIAYLEAAKTTLSYAESHPSYKETLKVFLSHFDNHRGRATELLAAMLPWREQWLAKLIHAKTLDQDHFASTLAGLQNHFTQLALSTLDDEAHSLLENILCYRAGFINDSLGNGFSDDFTDIKALANLLLTSSGGWRSRYTIKQGFPAASHFKTREEKDAQKQIKETIAKLSEWLTDKNELLGTLGLIQLMPDKPYESSEWDFLTHLFTLLPLLVAHLHLVFKDKSQVDFSEISLQASRCLGDEVPTELDLYLDYQIEHLLIDEFQDTSINQFELIAKLIRQWTPDDERTLFIVGDPMQSIYRFRQADVAVFLTAKEKGIADIPLTYLKLTCNFRSNTTVINWVNQLSQAIFPSQDSILLGAVSYSASQAMKQGESQLQAYACDGELAQAKQIAAAIKQYGDKKIAILVSNRNQLSILLPYLIKEGISVNGVDLHRLNQTPLISALYALTRVLHEPEQRLYWCQLLCSPLCGIDYPDLFLLHDTLENGFNDCKNSQAFTSLPSAVKERLSFVIDTINHYQQFLYRKPFYSIVYDAFRALNGELLIGERESDLHAFFQLLESETHYPIEITTLETKINKLYSSDNSQSNVDVMTIHKSKGLEFDTVILPSLNAVGKSSQSNLFKTLEVLDEQSHSGLLISPIKSSEQSSNAMYQFIAELEKRKLYNEKLRLLYVALTRAKSNLILLSSKLYINKGSKSSFLSLIKTHIEFEEISADDNSDQSTITFDRLQQSSFQGPIRTLPFIEAYEPKPPVSYDKRRLTGIYIHALMYHIAKAHYQDLSALKHSQLQHLLANIGIEPPDQDEVLARATLALSKVFQSSKGRWLISKHEAEENEYPLSTPEGNFVIDRTFIHNNTRYIIDYKFSELSQKVNPSYIAQLNNYAKQMSVLDEHTRGQSLPIQLVLYYPIEYTFIEWEWGESEYKKMVEKQAVCI